MPAPIGDIKEHAPDPLIDDDSGLSTGRNFTVIAQSQLHARTLLRQKKSVFRGAPFSTIRGEAPDSRVRCLSLQVTPRPAAVLGGSGMYDVNAHYGIPDGQTPLPGNPAVWNWSASLASAPVDTDRDGNPIQNAVGEPIDPPVTALLPSLKVTIQWFTSKFLVQDMIRFVGATNTDKVVAADGSGAINAGQALCMGMTRTPADDDLFRMSAEFSLRRDGWRAKLVNRGKRILLGTEADGTCKWELVTDTNGQPLAEPANLASDGSLLACAAAPVILTFDVYPEELYAGLGV